MKIGVISDTHDNLKNLRAALEMLQAEGVEKILHCGDLCGPEVVRALAGFDVRIARGNMDRHRGLAQMVEQTLGRGRLAWLQKLTVDGYSMAVLHGDNGEILHSLISSGRYAYIFHGHTHRQRDRTVGRTRVINPGALGSQRWQRCSFCILELATGQARFVEL